MSTNTRPFRASFRSPSTAELDAGTVRGRSLHAAAVRAAFAGLARTLIDWVGRRQGATASPRPCA